MFTMSDWARLEDIMQDLSVAQGYVVPAALETFTGHGPPAYHIEDEECEEQAHIESGGGGSGDFPAPNYRLIQTMLNMVKEDDQTDDVQDSQNHIKESTQKKKIQRNVALSSIMTAKEELSSKRPMSNDVIPVMFTKKFLKNIENNHRRENASPIRILSPSSDKSKQYTPSANASAYYSKYVEKSQLKEQFEEDIWARAERKMKELEERKKLTSKLSSPKERGNISQSEDAAFAALGLALPEHRHLMPGDCIVCVVAAKHGFYL